MVSIVCDGEQGRSTETETFLENGRTGETDRGLDRWMDRWIDTEMGR